MQRLARSTLELERLGKTPTGIKVRGSDLRLCMDNNSPRRNRIEADKCLRIQSEYATTMSTIVYSLVRVS